MSIKRDDLIRALTRKGFIKEKGSNHDKYFFYFQGKKQKIATVISRGSQYADLGKPIIAQMRKELGLSKDEFVKTYNCTYNEKDLINIYSNNHQLN
jgi:hypothetical protein